VKKENDMWNRRDFAVLATAVLATFGIVVGTFWPRVAGAVDGQADPTTKIEVPVLEVGEVRVTAVFDKDSANTVILTARNLSSEPASAYFQATANSIDLTLGDWRSAPPPRQNWSSEYALELQPYETQILTATLPDNLLGSSRNGTQVQLLAANGTTFMPPRIQFILTNPATKQTITAVDVAQGAVAAANTPSTVGNLTELQAPDRAISFIIFQVEP
jgi:hypothetical protein